MRVNINNIVIKKAKAEDAKKIYEIMTEVYDKLENKDIFVCDELEFVQNHICDNGFAIIACDTKYNNKIVACLIVRYPKMENDNLGNDIGLNSTELMSVAHMESAVVLPLYRGLGLQYKLIDYAEKLIDKTKYKYLMGTVSPDNPASYKTLEKAGYSHILTKEKYSNLLRKIYCKSI